MMNRFNSNILLEELMADVRKVLVCAGKLEYIDQQTLRTQPAPARWSVAQVLEHLNFYSRFYIRAIEDALHQHQTRPQLYFKPGWFGDYFTKMMKPTAENKIKSKMKTMKSAAPPPDIDGKAALAQFISDQHALLNLLQVSKSADIGKLRVPITISNLVKLKLGDTFRFLIGHEQRHMLQISNTLQIVSQANAQPEIH